MTIEPAELAEALRALARWAEHAAPPAESGVLVRLREHLGADPAGLPVVSEPLGSFERVNQQVALDAWSAAPGRSAEVIGLPAAHGYRSGLAELSRPSHFGPPVEPGPVEHTSVAIGDRTVTVIAAGLLLLRDGDVPLALMLHAEEGGTGEGLSLEAMAPRREQAERLLGELRELRAQLNVYRGKVLEVVMGDYGARFELRELPEVPRERIVLPPGVLERVERHTVGFGAHAAALLAAGRHLKRGLLLHGPPGTGKTLTIMHLAGRMPDRTVVLVTGRSLYGLGSAIAAARTLLPAMVVLEDVDLVARDRYEDESNPLLFELLNQMEGLQADADVVFVLTTNRADVLEPALAARPGRIDLAVELPLPDADGRRRLLALYAEGLEADPEGLEELVDRLEAVSPAFIREVLRRAALLAAEAGDARRLGRDALLAAADELADTRSQLTRRLLGTERDEGLFVGDADG